MTCTASEYWNSITNTCNPINSYKMDEKKYDGSGSVWGYIPAALPGLAQLVSAFKGNTQPQNVTYVQAQQPTSPFGGGNSMTFIIIAIVVLIIILLIAFRGSKTA